jgi:enamine deaminase RidA (YjgF/YER057c/UK114 family)
LKGDKSQGIAALSRVSSGAAYSDAVRIDAGVLSLLFVSGKTGTKDGALVGRSMREQAAQALRNVIDSVEAAGGGLQDIVRVRIYVTQIDSASIRDVHAVRAEVFAAGQQPASTLVRVDQLVRDGALVEIEADVVIAK